MDGRLAWLFPGEGAQRVGMGLDLYRRFPVVRETFREAEDLLDLPVEQLCFRGPASDLQRTEYCQPAMFVLSVAVSRLLARLELTPSATAGHGLGQYAALVAAGALTLGDACRLVRARSRLMNEICERVPGAMIALVGLPVERVRAICRESRELGIVRIANYNSPDEFVVSGETAAIDQVAACARRAGAAETTLLQVSGAFHSPLMQAAQGQFASFLEGIPIAAPRIPVVMDTIGIPAAEPAVIRSCLIEQLTAPVLWTDVVQWLLQQGITTFVEVGTGQLLSCVTRAVARPRPVCAFQTSSAESVMQMLQSLGARSRAS
jgi:[acyl-carrier-protein] S-malonyltransferase